MHKRNGIEYPCLGPGCILCDEDEAEAVELVVSDYYSKAKTDRLKAFKNKTYSMGKNAPVEFYPWFERNSDDIGGVSIEGTLDIEELIELVKVISEVNRM